MSEDVSSPRQHLQNIKTSELCAIIGMLSMDFSNLNDIVVNLNYKTGKESSKLCNYYGLSNSGKAVFHYIEEYQQMMKRRRENE